MGRGNGDGSESPPSLDNHPQIALINSFVEITNSDQRVALSRLEEHNFDLSAAVSSFLDDMAFLDEPTPPHDSNSEIPSPEFSPVSYHSRSRSPSPPPVSRSYDLRSSRADNSASGGRRTGGGGVIPLADLNTIPKVEDSDSDPDYDPRELSTGGQRSGMLVQDPSRPTDVNEIFNQARQSGAMQASAEHHLPSSSTRSFTGTGRLLSGEVSSSPSSTQQQPEVVYHYITFWRNGFTVDEGPLRRLDDPANASFLESIMKSECPQELAPANKRTSVRVNLMRMDEDFKESDKPRAPFQGVGRTLGSTSDETPLEPTSVSTVLTAAPAPSIGLVVDQTQPSTSIQLRLADGTRMVSHFNNHHTIRDIRGFIDASRPDGPRTYRLQTMGFPPKQLTDLNQTIDEAGIANSVVIQRI